MISKLGVGILTVAALLIAAPSNVFAATQKPDQKKIAAYLKKLNAVPVGSPAAKVSGYVKTLAGLDPKNAAKYMGIGLKKLYPTQANKTAVNALNKQVQGIVKAKGPAFGLSTAAIKASQKAVNNQNSIFQKRPTSPTAMLSLVGMPALA